MINWDRGNNRLNLKFTQVFFRLIKLNFFVRNFSGITNKVFMKETRHLIENFQKPGHDQKSTNTMQLSAQPLN